MRVHCFGVSLDGYGAGPNQNLENPLGVGGTGLMEWFFPTRTFQRMHDPESVGAPDGKYRKGDGSSGIDDEFAARGFDNIGAWIIGRNMFGPVRGPWLNDDWKGWWGDNPVYHCDVFLLTHHARAPQPMHGGTTFHFLTGGIEVALQQARTASKEKDVRVGGGVATLRAYLQARLVDEIHLAQSAVLLGSGEALFPGLDLPTLGYRVVERVPTEKTTHIVLRQA